MVAVYVIGYGSGAFAVGPLRQVGNLELSTVHCGTTVIAAAAVVLASMLGRPPGGAPVPAAGRT
jgi:hypothetical protein